ncbi:cell wall integrity and stress response component 4-like [Elysia marginata]|uniref:Cell wall integrity and stress response component 4-like n=1 Tax=Elysia marginata TaxID=1093978 RepID=A0AAV4GLE7_9GAST|nr:cell wall integrity and stress response component 4-like [Elysia marginata]
MRSSIACCVAFTLALLGEVRGHGRLVDPPARSSMWRFGFDTPVNNDDMALYCGGFQRQWEKNGGRCGVCGDPFDGSRDHEAGGKYATGIIAKRYTQGQTIEVSVDLTKSHLGWFEFRLCPHNNPNRRVSQMCLDRNLLRLEADGSTRYQVRSWASQVHTISLRLPPGVICTQCVLQWRYNAGNSWGCDVTGCCLGCGRQEQFYGCADIAISASGKARIIKFQYGRAGFDAML